MEHLVLEIKPKSTPFFSTPVHLNTSRKTSYRFKWRFTPGADATQDLGSTARRYIFSADLQLSNEGSANDVDGTWGKYTIQEGEDELEAGEMVKNISFTAGGKLIWQSMLYA